MWQAAYVVHTPFGTLAHYHVVSGLSQFQTRTQDHAEPGRPESNRAHPKPLLARLYKGKGRPIFSDTRKTSPRIGTFI